MEEVSLEEEVRRWIETMLGVEITTDTHTFLRDGVILCRLLNAVKPGTIKKVNKSAIAAFQMENITLFIRALREFGVAEQDLFTTLDLYEAKNMDAVLRGILSFGRAIQRVVPDFPGPTLGVREAAKRTIVIDEDKALEARSQPSRLTLGLSEEQLKLDKAYPVRPQEDR